MIDYTAINQRRIDLGVGDGASRVGVDLADPGEQVELHGLVFHAFSRPSRWRSGNLCALGEMADRVTQRCAGDKDQKRQEDRLQGNGQEQQDGVTQHNRFDGQHIEPML